MSALEIAKRVAFHPTIIRLRQKQIAMRNRLVNDYGHDFMGTGDDAYDRENGHEGVNRWTRPERDEWNNLARSLRNARATVRGNILRNA